MLEVPITIQVRKAVLRLKRQRGLTNLQLAGEFELLDLNTDDPEVLGRIDIIFQFLHQFGDEDAYLGIECKRVSPGDASLNRRYVVQGVARFVSGQYAAGHHWGMMLGYVLKCPLADLITEIDRNVRRHYGDGAKFVGVETHPRALSLHESTLGQGTSGHTIRLMHIFVDMTSAGTSLA
jgi:hypothetical protein